MTISQGKAINLHAILPVSPFHLLTHIIKTTTNPTFLLIEN